MKSKKGGGMGPIKPGEAYEFTVKPNSSHPRFNFASMIVPSNDTFASFGPGGLKLLDGSGNRRSETAIQNDVDSKLKAWDAGTELNQAGGAGPDQAGGAQSGPDTGPSEGNGKVRKLMSPVWSYPPVSDVLKVTVEPK